MELKRQAEEMQEIVSGMSEGTSLWRSGHSAVSFTQQPKIAVETNPESAHGTARRAAFGANRVAFANEPAATTAALAPPLPTAPPRAANTETSPGQKLLELPWAQLHPCLPCCQVQCHWSQSPAKHQRPGFHHRGWILQIVQASCWLAKAHYGSVLTDNMGCSEGLPL